MFATSDEEGRRAIAPSAWWKSTDHCLAPHHSWHCNRVNATEESSICGQYVSGSSALLFTFDIARSSTVRNSAPWIPRRPEMQNLGDRIALFRSLSVTGDGSDIQHWRNSSIDRHHRFCLSTGFGDLDSGAPDIRNRQNG